MSEKKPQNDQKKLLTLDNLSYYPIVNKNLNFRPLYPGTVPGLRYRTVRKGFDRKNRSFNVQSKDCGLIILTIRSLRLEKENYTLVLAIGMK